MSKLLPASALEAAERFIWLNARLIDRLRFAHLFRGAAAAPVVAALRPYQNPDGGLPFVLPSVRPYPRAPWWQTGDQPPGSLRSTPRWTSRRSPPAWPAGCSPTR